jgi:hypothetical protein
MLMNSAKNLTLLTLLLVLPLVAHAQLAAYITYSPTHLSSVDTGAVYTGTGYTEQTASYWSSGVGGGVTFTMIHVPVLSLGLDLRGSTKPGTAGSDSAMAGLKLTAHPPIIPFKPYVQVSGGYLDTRTTNISSSSNNASTTVGGTFTNKYGAYEILGGLDYPFIHFVDLRIIEIGAGKGYGFGTNNPTFVTLNTGFVVHF